MVIWVFSSKSKIFKLVRFARWGSERTLIKEFSEITRSCKLESFLISIGMEPESELPSSWRLVRLVKFPISAGMEPENEFKERSRLVRLARIPISAGIEP